MCRAWCLAARAAVPVALAAKALLLEQVARAARAARQRTAG